jgi:hypothetical protein
MQFILFPFQRIVQDRRNPQRLNIHENSKHIIFFPIGKNFTGIEIGVLHNLTSDFKVRAWFYLKNYRSIDQ